MAYLLGTNISDKKSIYIGLSLIYGLGQQYASKICFELGLNRNLKFKDLTTSQLTRIQKYISANCLTHGLLKKKINTDIQRYVDNKSYKGRRHRMRLPVRGQRTHTNARTIKRMK